MRRFDCSEARRCLDQAAAGVLPEEDRRALDAHLSFCDGCQAEQEYWELAVLAAQRVAPGPPRERSVVLFDADSGAASPRPRRRRPTPLAFAAVIVVLLLGGTALATVLSAPWRGDSAREEGGGGVDLVPGTGTASPDESVQVAPLDSSPAGQEKEPGVPQQLGPADAEAGGPTAPESAPSPPAHPSPDPPVPPHGDDGMDTHDLIALADPVAGTEAATLEQLLLRAREHRAQHRYAEACSVYEEVVAGYPGNPAAANARIALGQLLLGPLERPRDALAHFDGYLDRDPGGALAEDARVGRVRAFSALADGGEVVAACDDYLVHHPAGNAAAEVLLQRADARRKGGDCDGALADYAAVLDRWGDTPRATMAATGADACEGR